MGRQKEILKRNYVHYPGTMRQPQNLAEAFAKMSKACN